ncbi:MAG TPA: hypothetical protein PK239_09605 [Chitinophagales bacterium]|nr:hypothetical protein [Chitinophagales bacterium]
MKEKIGILVQGLAIPIGFLFFFIGFNMSMKHFFQTVPDLQGLTFSDITKVMTEHWKQNLEFPELNPVLKRAMGISTVWGLVLGIGSASLFGQLGEKLRG